MANIENLKNIENFLVNKININYEKFKEENPHLSPNFYFLILAIRVDKVKTLLDTSNHSTHSIRTSSRKRKRKQY